MANSTSTPSTWQRRQPTAISSLAWPSNRWLRIVPWINYDGCAATHDRARCLLSNLGTNAQVAIPDVIDCLENCRGLHFVNVQDLIETLGEISGTNPAAIPYLTKRARRDDAWSLRAAAMAYYIDGRTNLLAETCERLARKNSDAVLGGQELFWFREDHELNEHLVPLLEQLYVAPGLASRDQESIMFELQSRSNDATAALDEALTRLAESEPRAAEIARLLAMQTNAPVLVE